MADLKKLVFDVHSLFSNVIPVKIDKLTIKAYTLRQIIEDIGLEKYFSLIAFFNVDKDDLCEAYGIPDEEYYSKSKFKLMLSIPELTMAMIEFLKVSTVNDGVVPTALGGIMLLLGDNEYVYLDDTNIDFYMETIAKVCAISYEEEIDFSKCANETTKKAKRMIIKKQKKINSMKKGKTTFASILSSVCNKSNGITYESILNMTMYQIFDAYGRLYVIDNYDKTMQGLYFGTVSKDDIKQDEIMWSREI